MLAPPNAVLFAARTLMRSIVVGEVMLRARTAVVGPLTFTRNESLRAQSIDASYPP